MKTNHRIHQTTRHVLALALGLAASTAFLAGSARADTTITSGQTLDIIDSNTTLVGDTATWTDTGTLTIDNTGTLITHPSQAPGFNLTHVHNNDAIVLAGTAGSIFLKFYGNDMKFLFSGAVSGTATGDQIIDITTGAAGGGDRENVQFTSTIADGSSGSIGFHINYNTQSGANSYVNLSGSNTFTGPITLVKGNNVQTGFLVIGGERYMKAFDVTLYTVPGSGSLGGGTYPGNISLGIQTALDFNTSANQTLSGVISGVGTVVKEIAASTLTLAGLNTYTGNTTVSGGTLALASSGGMKFVVTDASSNKITGAGTATLDGAFTIDTTAVSPATSSGIWPLVDTTTKSFGANFTVAGFTGPDSNNAWVMTDLAGKIWIFDTVSGKLFLSLPAEIISFGIPGASGVIDQAAKTIALNVPWVPWGTALAPLSPTFTLSSGSCDKISGNAPSPSFAVQNPQTYSVNDNGTINDYTVTVTVTPASTGKAMSDVVFAGRGYAWVNDLSGTNLLMVVPSSVSVTALAPTFSVSPLATCNPPSGTTRDFTTPQTYTVTAQDSSTQVYTITVQRLSNSASGYQGRILASGPVSYWPLNETTGTTALDIASGINNITYGGTYTLGDVSLRADGNSSVLFTSATTSAGGYTGAPYNPLVNPQQSLNPRQFTVEFWYKHLNTTPSQYLVSLQDRSGTPTANRLGYAFQRNNSANRFQFTYGLPGNNNGTLQSSTDLVVGSVYYAVATYDGTTMSVYVNGVLNSSAPVSYVQATATQPGFTIGSRNGNTANACNIQDVAVYTRALTADEILFHYTGTAPTISYSAWATGYPALNLTNPAALLGGDLSNFALYAFGLDPSKPTAHNPISVPLNTSGHFSYTQLANSGLTYTVWTSTDLATWTQDAGALQTPGATANGVTTMAVQLAATPVGGKLFVRVAAQ